MVRGSLRLLLESHTGGLGGIGLGRDGGDGQAGDLSTAVKLLAKETTVFKVSFRDLSSCGAHVPEGEEVADLLLGGRMRDAGNVNSGSARHFDGFGI